MIINCNKLQGGQIGGRWYCRLHSGNIKAIKAVMLELVKQKRIRKEAKTLYPLLTTITGIYGAMVKITTRLWHTPV